jgi:hypothetical protein
LTAALAHKPRLELFHAAAFLIEPVLQKLVAKLQHLASNSARSFCLSLTNTAATADIAASIVCRSERRIAASM